MTFTEWYLKHSDPDNIFSPGMCPDKAIDFLVQYLLPEDYWTTEITSSQAITEIVYDILMKYSKKFRKEVKQCTKAKRKFSSCQNCTMSEEYHDNSKT